MSKRFGADIPFIRPKYLSGDKIMPIHAIEHSIKWCSKQMMLNKYNIIEPFNTCFHNNSDYSYYITYNESKSDTILFWVIVSFLGFCILIGLFVTVFHKLFKKNKNEKYILLESGPMINYSK